jgi:hypothetical protein
LTGPPVIRVQNQSTHELRSIVLAGNGFSEQISRLGAGESACVRAAGIQGESSLEFRADTNVGRIEATDLAYLEASGGYRVRIVVSPDQQVKASSELGSVSRAFCDR